MRTAEVLVLTWRERNGCSQGWWEALGVDNLDHSLLLGVLESPAVGLLWEGSGRPLVAVESSRAVKPARLALQGSQPSPKRARNVKRLLVPGVSQLNTSGSLPRSK